MTLRVSPKQAVAFASPRRTRRVQPVRPAPVAAMARAVVEVLDSGALRLQLPLHLKTPNLFWGAHWAGKRGKHHERRAWRVAITTAVLDAFGLRVAQQLLSPHSGLPGAAGTCTARRRVTVQRFVPHERQFIRDHDNQIFAEKPVYDALKELGLIRDDSDRWVERVHKPQQVAPDRLFWTVVEIAPVASERV